MSTKPMTDSQLRNLRYLQVQPDGTMLGHANNPGFLKLQELGMVRADPHEFFQHEVHWRLTDVGRNYSMAFGNVLKGPVRR